MRSPLLSYAIAILVMIIGCNKKNLSESVPSSQPLDFENSYSIATSYDELSEMLKVSIVLNPGFHAYAPGEKIGRAVNVEIAEQNGWVRKGAAIIPNGTPKGESMLLNGQFEIKVPAKKGVGPTKGTVFLQICTDTACDMPRKHEIEIRSK